MLKKIKNDHIDEEVDEMKVLVGKTIKTITFPNSLKFGERSYDSEDDNIQVEFTDGTILKLGSWDYEGYRSGIFKEIILKNA